MELSKENKGWIKIESEDDLPKEYGEYSVFVKYNKTVITLSRDYLIQAWYTNQITHYQPIIKPKPPIY